MENENINLPDRKFTETEEAAREEMRKSLPQVKTFLQNKEFLEYFCEQNGYVIPTEDVINSLTGFLRD